MSFAPFDPLSFKNTTISEAALASLKREIQNILSSYVGWYDPFCELVQNALDAVEARVDYEKSAGTVTYAPKLDIRIDLDDNSLTVTDNGIGLDKDKFQQFLAPNFSFKTGNTRGHKGVGATYVAYGFNYIRVSTKVPGFEASGRILNGRKWLGEHTSGDNPKVEPDESPRIDSAFDANDRGVSVTVRFDDTTHPKKLSWIGAETAEIWGKILDIKTGLGSVTRDSTTKINVEVIKDGSTLSVSHLGTSYFWLHESAAVKKATYRELAKAAEDLHAKHGAGYKMPDKYNNLDFIYETWTSAELSALLSGVLDEEELDVVSKHSPTVSVEFGCTAKLWSGFNESLGLRPNYRVLLPGIQLAANNMPQGDVIQVPLVRYTGRQQQVHFLIHFENYTPDLGRKGFHRELTDFAKSIARHLMENQLAKFRGRLKANTGVAPDLLREMQISDWKKDMLKHEEAEPLTLSNEHFFKPTEKVSITSKPTREQDVIALFHQLIAGGVIRGLSIMSTNERFTYDGLFKVAFDMKSDYMFTLLIPIP